MNIVVISAGMSDASTTRMLADRIAAAASMRRGAAQLGDGSVETVSLRELAHDIVDANLTGFASPRLQHVYDSIAAADALIAVTPIFKASYTGLFKSFFDALDNDALIGKPVILAATGGTARHSLAIDFAMRPLFAHLQALVMPTGIFASPHDWGSSGSTALQARIDRAAGELAGVLAGAGTGRAADDEFDMFSDSMLAAARP